LAITNAYPFTAARVPLTAVWRRFGANANANGQGTKVPLLGGLDYRLICIAPNEAKRIVCLSLHLRLTGYAA
jgi:hypothetical protein